MLTTLSGGGVKACPIELQLEMEKVQVARKALKGFSQNRN
jgi:hypothetical protein